VFSFLVSFLAIYFIASCSDAKRSQDGFKKFIKYGGKVNCENDTIWKKDTTYLAGKMIIDSFPIPCDCADVETPKTLREIKWKYKYDLKRQKERDAFVIDSLDKIHKHELKLARNDKKVIKSNNKVISNQSDNDTKESTANNKSWNIFWIVIAILALLIFLTLKYLPK
jgi:hypothetical protein